MAARMYLGFEEKYLSKHFEKEYIAYRNNCIKQQQLLATIPTMSYRMPQKPAKHSTSYQDLGKIDGSSITLDKILEKCDGFEPANITISVTKDFDGDIESFDFELSVFGENPRYEVELARYETEMAKIEENKAALAIVEKRLYELADIFDAALAKLL